MTDKQQQPVRGPIDWSETIQKTVSNFDRILEDYAPAGDDPFTEDSPAVDRLKRIIAGLSVVDRRIIILYAELHNTRNVAKALHLSHRTTARRIARIKADIVAKFQLKQ